MTCYVSLSANYSFRPANATQRSHKQWCRGQSGCFCRSMRKVPGLPYKWVIYWETPELGNSFYDKRNLYLGRSVSFEMLKLFEAVHYATGDVFKRRCPCTCTSVTGLQEGQECFSVIFNSVNRQLYLQSHVFYHVCWDIRGRSFVN